MLGHELQPVPQPLPGLSDGAITDQDALHLSFGKHLEGQIADPSSPQRIGGYA